MLNIPITLTFKIDPQTQQFITRSLETFGSFLMLYTPADVQAANDLGTRAKAMQVRLDMIDKHLTTGPNNAE